MIALVRPEGVHHGGNHMKKILTSAALAGAVLALTACGAKKEEAAAETADTEAMAPAEAEPAATDEAAAAAEGLDPTGNPIRPPEANTATSDAEAPAAE